MEEDLFTIYKNAIEKDLTITRLNLEEKALQVPAIKHFWVGKLIEAKRNLRKLEDEKKEILKQVNDNKEIMLELSKASINKMIINSPKIQEINNKIKDTEEIIEYLTYCEKIFNYMGNDIKNIIDLIKMETL